MKKKTKQVSKENQNKCKINLLSNLKMNHHG